MILGNKPSHLANAQKVLCAETDMTNFVVKDSLEQFGPICVTLVPHPGNHRRSDIESACFEDHRDDRQSGGDVMARFFGRLPQTIMGRQRAIMASE